MRRLALLTLLLWACSESGPARDAATASDATAGPRDAATADAQPARDVAASADAAPNGDVGPNLDAMTVADAAPADVTVEPDTGPRADATPAQDAAATDAAVGPTRGTCSGPADCAGAACLSIPSGPNGWRTCDARPVLATACTGGFDACCRSPDCVAQPGGACFSGPLFYCGGAFPGMDNVCAYPECAVDLDCTATTRTDPIGLCVPAGAFAEPVARCSYGDCRVDAECTARAGGQCRPLFNPCNRRLDGFHCTYADSACREDADCAATPFGYCAAGEGGNTTCQSFIPPP